MRPLVYRIMTLGLTLLLGSGMFLMLMLALQSASAAQADSSSPTSAPLERLAFRFQPTPSAVQVSSIVSPPLVLAEYQAWFGLPSHIAVKMNGSPYTSTSPSVITKQIQSAKAMGIGGFVVDWYGPPVAGFLNNADRGFIDKATSEMITQAGSSGFRVALMYDEGAVSGSGITNTISYTNIVLNDLLYAKQYFSMTAYLRMTTTTGITNAPAIFVFPYDNVDPYIDWAYIRNQLTTSLGIPVILLDKDPKPWDPTHINNFNGFYAWVQPANTGWKTDGTEWGKDYLYWFYHDTMNTITYSNKIAIGGVWPGFDDSLASWGSHRYMGRRCGQTWRDTWGLTPTYTVTSILPFVMIETWNDFEEGTFVEGTDIERGRGVCLIPSQSKFTSPSPGAKIVYTHTLVNTGKVTDTFTIITTSTWLKVDVNPISPSLPSYSSTTIIVTITLPNAVSTGMWNRTMITATSVLSPSVHCSVMDTTTIFAPVYTYTIFLPLVSNQKLLKSITLPLPCSTY